MRALSLAVPLAVALALPFPVSAKCQRGICGGERVKLLDARKLTRGDIYNPGHGRRLQIRNKHRQIIGYIERSGKITDKYRRRRGEIEGLEGKDR